MTRLHLVDGTFELFRAHYSKRPPQVTAEGRDVKATVGVMASMLALLADSSEQPTHVAVAFDNPIRSFRNRLFSGYKTEAGVPEELLAQFDLVEDAPAEPPDEGRKDDRDEGRGAPGIEAEGGLLRDPVTSRA